MRTKNWRLVITGGVLAVLAVVFFIFMMSLAPQSNDPAALMEIVGQVSGVVIALSIVMAVVGFIGKKS
ncbi:MAG: hypothetical protein K8S25_12910 [Alphaproteobacteria bacterium]|nr:hypothetical protein [Alphaproteobacteria bacterium]